jgi:hypothetical protein
VDTLKIDARFVKVQNGLFERAHSEPCELKFLAIGMKKQGIQDAKLYGHPEMIPLPMSECEYLSSLNPRQLGVLSAMSYANFYQNVSASEMQTLKSNMYVADKVFAPYSDEYMVLYQETAEEYDHTWAFRTIHSTACRAVGIQDSFTYGGFFSGEGGFSSERIKDNSFGLKFFNFLITDAIQILPHNLVRSTGLGALWLLYRYISNVSAKQVEAFAFDSPDKFSYEPLALELTNGHATDEARHYTTSYDLGMELYKAADPFSQRVIHSFITKLTENFICGYFRTFNEMMNLEDKGVTCSQYRIGLKSLNMALKHPEFADKQVDLNKLVLSWREKGYGQEPSPLVQKRWRYTAQQLERLVDALDLHLKGDEMGESYKRYQKAPAVATA